MPDVGRWMNIDPLAERRHELTPYNYVQNSPLIRIDPNGLTDFTLNRKTGEVKQVGAANDNSDRILKTNRKGEVKTNKKGEAKVAVDNIEGGILKEGQNFKTGNNLIQTGGKGMPTKNGVEAFALKLSDYIGVEIAGAYYSKDGSSSVTHIGIGRYDGNTYKSAASNGTSALREATSNIVEYNSYSLRGFFHTHPSGVGISDSDRLVPSDADLNSRDNALRNDPTLQFFNLITQPEYGESYPKVINYSKGFGYRLK